MSAFRRVRTGPVRVLDDAPVDPLLQYFKVRDAGCFSEVETQLLSLAVAGVVEGSVMKKTQCRPAHTFSFVHRGRCEKSGRNQKRLPKVFSNVLLVDELLTFSL